MKRRVWVPEYHSFGQDSWLLVVDATEISDTWLEDGGRLVMISLGIAGVPLPRFFFLIPRPAFRFRLQPIVLLRVFLLFEIELFACRALYLVWKVDCWKKKKAETSCAKIRHNRTLRLSSVPTQKHNLKICASACVSKLTASILLSPILILLNTSK